nr:MAG TPA: hypothetical protein [Caudoviricetes sp.]
MALKQFMKSSHTNSKMSGYHGKMVGKDPINTLIFQKVASRNSSEESYLFPMSLSNLNKNSYDKFRIYQTDGTNCRPERGDNRLQWSDD